MRTLIWNELLTYVWQYDSGEIEVNTPISIERGFETIDDAITFAESWGYNDPRNI